MTVTNISGVATANINGETIDTMYMGLRGYHLSFSATSTGFNQADATVKLQHSNDASNWADVTDGSVTMASGSATSVLTPVVDIAMRYYRCVFTKNTNSAGSVVVIVNLM